jgi:hypothetical protein
MLSDIRAIYIAIGITAVTVSNVYICAYLHFRNNLRSIMHKAGILYTYLYKYVFRRVNTYVGTHI